jgi:heme-degrading monooxygenase HmoA
MFMRFVQLGIKPEAGPAFERFYKHRVGPALLNMEGCVFAKLIRSTDQDSEFISFTLWETQAQAQAYEDSGQYQALLKENEPFETVSNEWKIQLTEDNTLEYRPVRNAPDVKALPIVAGSSQEDAPSKLTRAPYIRLLNAKVNQDRFDDLSDTYANVITPELMKIDGCQAAYLIGMPDKTEGLSVTIWESQEKAAEYEASGKFAELMQKVAPYLSSWYQWKMTLDAAKRDRMHSSEEISVKGYKSASGESE